MQFWKKVCNFQNQRNSKELSDIVNFQQKSSFSQYRILLLLLSSLLSLLPLLSLLLLLLSICCYLGIKLILHFLEIVFVAFSHTLTGSVNQPRFTKVKYLICIIILSYNLFVTYFTYNLPKNGN